MATQKDLDVLKQKLSDLDAKLKSMGGGSAQRNPRFDSAIANQNYKNSMIEQRARMEADKANRRMTPMSPRGDFTQGRLMGAPIPQNPNAKEFDQFITKSIEGSQTQNQPPLAPIPQNPQMATYNNFLQQGIQRSNTMNQGAMTDFANMQPGMQATQSATDATPKPAMPLAGMGMQQSNSAPRKFSTVKAPPARFG